jgi:hypothetical protein
MTTYWRLEGSATWALGGEALIDDEDSTYLYIVGRHQNTHTCVECHTPLSEKVYVYRWNDGDETDAHYCMNHAPVVMVQRDSPPIQGKI